MIEVGIYIKDCPLAYMAIAIFKIRQSYLLLEVQFVRRGIEKLKLVVVR